MLLSTGAGGGLFRWRGLWHGVVPPLRLSFRECLKNEPVPHASARGCATRPRTSDATGFVQLIVEDQYLFTAAKVISFFLFALSEPRVFLKEVVQAEATPLLWHGLVLGGMGTERLLDVRG